MKKPPPDTRIKAVVIEERIDNTIHITYYEVTRFCEAGSYNGIELKYKKIEKRPLKPKEEKEQFKDKKDDIPSLVIHGEGLR